MQHVIDIIVVCGLLCYFNLFCCGQMLWIFIYFFKSLLVF